MLSISRRTVIVCMGASMYLGFRMLVHPIPMPVRHRVNAAVSNPFGYKQSSRLFLQGMGFIAEQASLSLFFFSFMLHLPLHTKHDPDANNNFHVQNIR